MLFRSEPIITSDIEASDNVSMLASSVSDNGLLINVGTSTRANLLAEKYVTIAETERTEESIIDARLFAGRLEPKSHKIFNDRIDLILSAELLTIDKEYIIKGGIGQISITGKLDNQLNLYTVDGRLGHSISKGEYDNYSISVVPGVYISNGTKIIVR